jgi:hypothetical protein
MLSSTHAIFKGLQDELKKHLTELPQSAPLQLRRGLINAHRKLSDYFYTIDKSPYYLWSASKCTALIFGAMSLMIS